MPKTKEKKKAGKKAEKQTVARDQLFDALVDLARNYRTALGAALNDLDIYPGQEQLLFALEKSGPLPPSQLAEMLGVRPPTVTKMVSRLSAKDLVVKTKQADDGRMVVIALTDAGDGIMKQLAKRKKRVEKVLLGGLSKEESKNLRRLLEKANQDRTSE